MQRVVLLFVAILTVLRASPFGQDDRLNLLRNAFRQGDESLPDLEELIGGLEPCGNLDDGTPIIPEGGCVYATDSDVHFIQVVPAANLLPLLQATHQQECDNPTGNISDVQDNCYILSEDGETLYYFNVYDLDAFDVINDFADRFGELGICEAPAISLPEEGCVFFINGTVGIMNVLNEDNTDSIKKELDDLHLTKCIFDEGYNLLTKGACYWVYEEIGAIYFVDVNNEGGVEDEEETYESANAEIPSPTSALAKVNKL